MRLPIITATEVVLIGIFCATALVFTSFYSMMSAQQLCYEYGWPDADVAIDGKAYCKSAVSAESLTRIIRNN